MRYFPRYAILVAALLFIAPFAVQANQIEYSGENGSLSASVLFDLSDSSLTMF